MSTYSYRVEPQGKRKVGLHQDRPTQQQQHDTSLAKITQNDHDAAVISDTTTNTTTNRQATFEEKIVSCTQKFHAVGNMDSLVAWKQAPAK
jgi:hypothetical protein